MNKPILISPKIQRQVFKVVMAFVYFISVHGHQALAGSHTTDYKSRCDDLPDVSGVQASIQNCLADRKPAAKAPSFPVAKAAATPQYRKPKTPTQQYSICLEDGSCTEASETNQNYVKDNKLPDGPRTSKGSSNNPAPEATTSDNSNSGAANAAPAAIGTANTAADVGGAAATEVTEFDAPMFACLGATIAPFKFPKTVAAAKKFSALNKEFMTKCNEGTLDTAVSAVPAAVGAAGGSGVESTGATSLLSGTSLSAASSYEGLCEPMEAEVEKLNEEVRTIHQREKTECEIQAINDGNFAPPEPLIPPVPPTPPAVHVACTKSITANKASCNKVTIEVETWQKKALAFLKAHWGKILLALGALGVGLYALNSSSDKQKEEFQTNPTPGPTTEKDKDKEADKDKGKDDIVNAGDTTPTNTPAPTADTQTTNTTNNSGKAAYCRSSNQPLECFVTPGCDLKCVADKYGVSNYAGMDKDTTRIDKNGRPVDGASAATGNPGGSSSSLGGDSKSSGKGGAALNASGETGSGNGGSNVGTRSASGYGDGSDGFGGGGGGGFGDSSNRDPASNDRYKGQGIFGGKNAAGSKDPAATGPLLPITANLFERISNVAKTQCVRELVLCNQK